MKTIKVTTMHPYHPLARQLPGRDGVWHGYRFLVDHDAGSCDYWVVLSGVPFEMTVNCPPQNTIFIGGEPPSVKRYNTRFLRQFGTVVTCQADLDHPNLVITQQGHPWHVGINRVTDLAIHDYDALSAMTNIDKPKELSIVCSSKDFTDGHRARLAFLNKLREHFGDRLDVFGRGIRPVGDKWEAVAPYRYHIAIENAVHPNYISEKLTDSFVAGAHPFYHGCPNTSDYFPADSYTPIDIARPEQAIATIEQAIADNRFDKTHDAMAKARDLTLNEHNFFTRIALVCDTLGNTDRPRTRTTIMPEPYMANPPSLPLRTVAGARRLVADITAPLRKAA